MAEVIERTIDFGSSPFALPNPRTQLLGRSQELAALLALLRDDGVPLVSVTGPGGVGKTRLAVQAARDLREDFDESVAFISLADVTRLEMLVRRVAQHLRLAGLEGTFSESALIAALSDRSWLLVLDNLEQIPDAGQLLARLVDTAPMLKLLVTSRIAMHIRGEVEFPLEPLSTPRQDALKPSSLDEIARNPAVMLFVDRARTVDPAFELNAENASDIAQICARLDGLPLAIELASARLKILTPASLLARLDNRLRILAGGARDLPDRQQNLRQTIAWSYDLLESSERAAFRALSVFAGGFSMHAAATVLGVGDEDPELLDTLGTLVDQSLLRRIASLDGEPRLAMLETIREFGLEQLAAFGEDDALRASHAEFYRRFVEQSEDRASMLTPHVVSDELEIEMPNIHQALDWYIGREDADSAVSIVLAMSGFWMRRGYLVEGSRLMERAVEFVDRVEIETQVRMLRWSAWFICMGGNTDEALIRVERAIEMAKGLETTNELIPLMNLRGVIHYYRKDLVLARAALLEALEASVPGQPSRAGVLNNLGVMARLQGEFESARAYLEESLAERAKTSKDDFDAHTLLNLADVWIELGDKAKARSFIEEWFSDPRRLRNPETASGGGWGAARLAYSESNPAKAAELLGWSDEQQRRYGHVDQNPDRQDESMRAALIAQLGEREFERLMQIGTGHSADEIVAMAIARSPATQVDIGAMPIRATPSGTIEPLTPRELEVARLVAEGKSTREIADKLFISTRTAQTHITNILGKLDLESRAGLAAWVVRNDPASN